MTVLASEGILGFGPQSAKGTEATTYYRHRALRVDFGPQQVQQQFPPEVGGTFHPTGAYKMMAFGGGQTVIHPRLENVVGWLLYGGTGKLSNMAATPEAGITRHRFTPPDEANDMPWMSFKRYIPRSGDASTDIGEVILDGRVAGTRLVMAPGQIVSAMVTLVGREPELAEDVGTGEAHAWSWGNTYEDYPSVPLAHQGSFKLPAGAAEQKATGLTVDIVNRYTNPQEELIIGSPYPDDFALLTQVMQFSWIYKWQDQQLYKRILSYGETADGNGRINWSPVCYSSDCEVIALSPDNISGLSNPYRLRVYAQNVTWASQGPPTLVGGGWLALRFTGTAQAQTDPNNYFFIDLDNETANYAWP
jgi:hypothetical protein